MTRTTDQWLQGQAAPAEPTHWPVMIEPSPEGADDTARLLTIATFNGLCRVVTALAERGLLLSEELEGLHEAMTFPLDDPEMRDDEVIACFRFTLQDVLAKAQWVRRTQRDSN